MEKIKFGSDGWQAIIAKDFTITNIIKIAFASSQWLTRKYKEPSTVIGYDCRFAGEMFMEAVAKILASRGVRVYIPEHFVSTPMVSLGVVKTNSDIGVVITASHNPPSYNGYKLKSKLGGPMVPANIAEVEAELPEQCTIDLPDLPQMLEEGMLNYIDL